MSINEFAKNLKEERETRKMAKQTLANYLDVDRSLVYQWEAGICEPDLDMLCKICYIFDISLDEMLGLNSPTKREEIEKTIKKKKPN